MAEPTNYRSPVAPDPEHQCNDCRYFELDGEVLRCGGLYGPVCHRHNRLVEQCATCDDWEPEEDYK